MVYISIWGILMVNVTIYSSTMDPMGRGIPVNPKFHQPLRGWFRWVCHMNILQSQVTRILKTLRLVRVFRFIMALRTLAPWSMDTWSWSWASVDPCAVEGLKHTVPRLSIPSHV